ncbi:MAG: hypothetical protein LCH53_11705 [Bacteroidetes bacterium]|nr:hypothetical protein [Bacteroidota bacterium]
MSRSSPPSSDFRAVLVPWSRTRLFVPLATPAPHEPSQQHAVAHYAALPTEAVNSVLTEPSGDGQAVASAPAALSPPPDGRPPEWVYETHSRHLSDAALLDLYVSLRELARPVRLERQEGVLRREILRRMRVGEG